MSGKAYTMREMKTIVEYLSENKLYGEIKGRKMWMDFSSSNLTNRSWQSLKETFLKRILPDIHNPYYKLKREEIISFTEGCDIQAKEKNKLEIVTVSDDSNSNGIAQTTKENEESSTGNNDEGEKTKGEDTKSSKISSRNRSSADTVVLENCYETAEEIQRALESPKPNSETKETPLPNKTIRDYITYSEPLTPMLQEVLHDFASESECSDKEPQMEIVENPTEMNNQDSNDQKEKTPTDNKKSDKVTTDVGKNAKGLSAEVVEEVLLSETHDNRSQPAKNNTSKVDEPQNKITECKSDEKHPDTMFIHSDNSLSGVDANNKSKGGTESKTNDTTNHVMTEGAQNINKENTNTHHTNEKTSQNCSNNTIDTVLPNNQEGLVGAAEQTQKEINTQDLINIESQTKASRKRASPQDNLGVDNKKKKEDGILCDAEKENNDVMPVTNNNSKDNQKTLENKSDIEEMTVANNIEKPQGRPTTSKQTIEADKIITLSNSSDKDKSPEPNNPCLKSVSLFAEQFNDTKYSDSETSDILISTEKQMESKEETLITPNEVVKENVVLLKSHSESDSNHEKQVKESKMVSQATKRQRNKAIANVFGFSSGAAPSNRKTRLSLKRSNSQHRIPDNMGPASSEWTSESESEVYVSPPRGRKNRQTKKFLKPKSARILSLEEDGGLFVMYGKKIFPLVKDGKIVKNYLTYEPNSDSEFEDETYWKIKYEKEKKKSEELKKLLEAKEPISRETASPILPTHSHRTTSIRNQKQSTQSISKSSVTADTASTTGCEDKKDIKEERIKIKFTRNNEEVHLEGHWPQIHPVLEQVVSIFHKEVDAQVHGSRPKIVTDASEHSKEINSGKSTPIIQSLVDPETKEKVNKIETEIFKEIEKIDMEQQSDTVVQETNVTKRKPGRPRISSNSSASAHSPAKRARRSKNDELVAVESDNKSRVSETELENEDVNVPKLRSRTPRKILNEAANSQESRPTRSRKSKQKQQEVSTIIQSEDDDGVRYMFPPNRKKSLNKSASNNNKKVHNNRSSKYAGMSSPDNLSRISESTQGYQDSDVSPIKLKKKRKLSLSTILQYRDRKQYNQRIRRKSYPCYTYGMSTDSSNSADTIKNKTSINTPNSSEAYKSDSYRFLFPKQKNCIGYLERIDETSPNANNFTNDKRHFDAISTIDKCKAKDTNSSKTNTDIGSSSNISMPLSPELSVVENISISKDFLGIIEDRQIVKETQYDAIVSPIYRSNKYTISDIDVSIPLMEQVCELHKSKEYTKAINDKRQSRPSISESLLNQICTVNIDDNCTMSDSLDRKLQQLLLESAKKMTRGSTNDHTKQDMDVDESLDVAKKSKAKKRSSTPRKKRVTKKSEVPKVDAVVEECMEFCSYGGRTSCPPSIQVFDDNAMGLDGAILINNNNEPSIKLKARKKKDIIKVKIVRPRNKSKSNEKLDKPNNSSKVSVCTDSGINDTECEAFLPGFNDSVDLIHNHSETCLHAYECVDNSVEFIETSNTVISLNSNSIPSGYWQGGREQFEDAECILPNILADHLQVSPDHIESTGETVYHTPADSDVLNTSLITEDLSDVPTQPQSNPSKWYLFNEDESTNSNIDSSTRGGYGANLNQLFPITCAVPDLSTITEMSRENEDSRKPTLDLNIRAGENYSQSMFNI